MKKGAVIWILVSFHPLKILFLPEYLDEDQGETGKDGIWKGHTFPSVALSSKGYIEPALTCVLWIL